MTMGTLLFSYKVSWGIHSVLNSGVTGFCFESKLKKSSEDLFFGCHEGKLETFGKISIAASLETLHKDSTVHCKSPQQQAVLNEISRTAPVCVYASYLKNTRYRACTTFYKSYPTYKQASHSY